jgi:hypothetical protein
MTKPAGYRPYQDLAFCSNRLIGGGTPLATPLGPIVLVGKGITPQIWLWAPTSPGLDVLPSLVEGNVSRNAAIAVEVNEVEKSVAVALNGSAVVTAREIAPDMAAVTTLDLRPAGWNVYGNEGGLSAAGMTLSGNHIEGGGTLLRVG